MKSFLAQPFAILGGAYLSFAETLGGAVVLLGRIIRALVPPSFDREQTWLNLYRVGVKSAPIVIVTALFVGAILVIQAGFFVQRTGATSFLGLGVGYSVFAEVGPILIGLMFSGRVGANNTAELGTMCVTEQVDALRALAIDPIRYLVVPRFVAMMVMMTLLMVLGDVFAILGAALTCDIVLGVNWEMLITDLLLWNLLPEFILGMTKAFFFGISISCISCYYGLNVRGGAPDVGRAVNNSVVANAIGIFVLDFIAGYTYTL
jgi:phospholipid/cholesterol/gamma-HCH transport system permease protein